jgi:hypothetical protein
LQKEAFAKLGCLETELAHEVEHFGCVFGIYRNPDIQISGCAIVAVITNGVTTYEEVINAVGIQ